MLIKAQNGTFDHCRSYPMGSPMSVPVNKRRVREGVVRTFGSGEREPQPHLPVPAQAVHTRLSEVRHALGLFQNDARVVDDPRARPEWNAGTAVAALSG